MWPADFHPALRAWFRETLGEPTPVQAAAWPAIAAGRNVLISAPTGSGKTLAAWLPLIDCLLKHPPGRSGVQVVYVSPLRALSRDMARSLQAPLEGVRARGGGAVGPIPAIGLRCGDTTPAERARQRRKPPELLVTTPESLFVLLGSRGGRRMLAGVRAAVVDEIHALAPCKRGAHLALSMERLEAHVGAQLQRIGLSATQRPLSRVARFLAGRGRDCELVEAPAAPAPEVHIELPDCPLGPFAHQAHRRQIYERLASLATDHGPMLVFCRTRAEVERTAAALAERLDEKTVAAHHGSLDKHRREAMEGEFKAGLIRVMVSSASLELGLDIGCVELVCQLGSPGGINSFLQRAGRARHRPGERPRARLFPLSLTDLLEARALVDALRAGRLDKVRLKSAPVDVLCQHLAAMVASGMGDPEAIFGLVRRARPWADFSPARFDAVLRMVTDGFVPGRDAFRARVARRAGGRVLEASEDCARVALLNAGTIPEWFEYRVLRAADGREMGRLDEEFAFESAPGQILQLGNCAYRVLRIQPGTVWVEDAPDETPNVPFWFGDGNGRSPMLCRAVQERLDGAAAAARGRGPPDVLDAFLRDSRCLLGGLPGRNRIVVERFVDPGGDRHVVIHAPHGARLNRAWGLALRKRFCRRFNFELQAAATDDGILISLGPTHDFELAKIISYLKSDTVRVVLIQALLDTPLFQTRFRWCATNALALLRRTGRGPVPPQIQRNQAENLIALVFPDQLACLENLRGERQVPDHPLVVQTIADCLEEATDATGLERLLGRIEAGEIEVHAVDTPEPSPLAQALIHAPRHSYLDPAGAEERRTRSFESAPRAPGRARARPRSERGSGWIPHSGRRGFERALFQAGYLLQREGETGVSATGRRAAGGWIEAFQAMVRERSAVSFMPDPQRTFWVAVARLPELRAVWPDGRIRPFLPGGLAPDPLADADEALARLLSGRIRILGAVGKVHFRAETGLPAARLEAALFRLGSAGMAADRWDTMTANQETANRSFNVRNPVR